MNEKDLEITCEMSTGKKSKTKKVEVDLKILRKNYYNEIKDNKRYR